MSTKKIYSIRWEDDDGEQGYYVQMTPFEARGMLAFLRRAADREIIGTPKVEPIEGEWLLKPAQFREEFVGRYEEHYRK